ncbi:FG-GAP repeat protein [Marinicella rhabdoformis]|uniref:FG-GAP repeat protein n=1 Tax=Marinicella rhabdoformis TaxID=2580566 RepID=UPI0012AEBBD2|nr:FG-GAP repeat protein [Marinicella rhabdoformis]
MFEFFIMTGLAVLFFGNPVYSNTTDKNVRVNKTPSFNVSNTQDISQAVPIEKKLVPSDPQSNARFGSAVGVWENRALISAKNRNNPEDQSGAVYAYEFDGANWIQTQKINASDAAAFDGFGYSISMNANRALISSASPVNGIQSGAVYYYENVDGFWEEKQKFSSSDGVLGDRFGISMELDGDRAIFGAIYDDENENDSGSAYIFEFNGNQWTEVQRLNANDASDNDRFGYSVSLSGNNALVSAILDDDNGSASGSAYVFKFNGKAWVQDQKLTPTDGSTNDRFGISSTINGNNILVGSSFSDTSGLDSSGSAYIFEFDGKNWIEKQKLFSGDPSAEDNFGDSVSLNKSRALVSAPGTSYNVDPLPGYVYVYDFNGVNWYLSHILTASDREEGDMYGSDTSLFGNTALIGDFLNEDAYIDSGSSYIYSLPVNPFERIYMDGFEGEK